MPGWPPWWAAAACASGVVLKLSEALFEAAGRELRDGVPMALRTTGWQRMVLRHTILRRLLRGGPFPGGARSPRETRPPAVPDGEPADLLIRRFEASAVELEGALAAAGEADPKRRLTHPYFGRLPLAEI
jgi:hypothetical protein